MTALKDLKIGNRVRVMRKNDEPYESGPPVGLVGEVLGFDNEYHPHMADNPIVYVRWDGGYNDHLAARRKQLRKLPDRRKGAGN